MPGGHLEYGETMEDCARREVLEETGLHLGALRFGRLTETVLHDVQRHYITLFMIGSLVG